MVYMIKFGAYALLPVKTVGVIRTRHLNTLVIKTVTSEDGMTAAKYNFTNKYG